MVWKDQQLANDLPWFHSFLQCFHLATSSHLLYCYCKYLKLVRGERIHSQICYQIPFIFVAGLSFTCLWFSESTEITRVSLTTLSMSVVAKQAVGHSDRKGQAIVGHVHF